MKSNKLFFAIAITLFVGSAMADGLSQLSHEYIIAQQSFDAPAQTRSLAVQPAVTPIGISASVTKVTGKSVRSATVSSANVTFPG